jgi:hypothetical protein
MKRQSGCAALIWMIVFAVCAARAEESEQAEMTVVVCNQAHLDAAQLETALQAHPGFFATRPSI